MDKNQAKQYYESYIYHLTEARTELVRIKQIKNQQEQQEEAKVAHTKHSSYSQSAISYYNLARELIGNSNDVNEYDKIINEL